MRSSCHLGHSREQPSHISPASHLGLGILGNLLHGLHPRCTYRYSGTLKGVFKLSACCASAWQLRAVNKKPIELKPAVENVITQLNSEIIDSYITKETQARWRQIAFVLLEKGRFC